MLKEQQAKRDLLNRAKMERNDLVHYGDPIQLRHVAAQRLLHGTSVVSFTLSLTLSLTLTLNPR